MAIVSSTRRWWLLAALGLAQLMMALDTTVITIALPSIQADLGFADSTRQWIVTGYALAFGSLLLLSGRLGDRWVARTHSSLDSAASRLPRPSAVFLAAAAITARTTPKEAGA